MGVADAQQFEDHRRRMFSIAYRMLGSVAEAEDIVQEAYLRYQASSEPIVSPRSFLTTVVTRLCLNQLQSARSQREDYFGPWLPEPVLTGTATHASLPEQAELHESISLAFLVLLEQLTPLERAVFLLREVFDYGYGEIATILEREEAACRQIFSRAKKHIAVGRPRFTPTPDAHRDMLARFLKAVGSGEFDQLLHLLADDVVLWADSGGKLRGALRRPLHGRDVVARFLLASSRFSDEPLQPTLLEVNGETAIALRAQKEIRLVIALGVAQDRISIIRVIGNPDKLRRLH